MFEGETAELQSLCEAITDCHHSTPNWTESGWIVVRSENIKNGKISLNDPSYTDQVSFQERIARSVPTPGDLIITREAPMGEIGMIPEGVTCCLGQRQVLIKPDAEKVNRHYLLYAMQSPFVQMQIGASDATGSTVSNLRIPLLKELAIPLIGDVQARQKISELLSSLDTKIDLNNRINAELEALAKTIYDYWFVQFDFPDAKGRPYKTSGGKMVWNEALKRAIPEEWTGGDISAVAAILGGATPSKADPDYWDGDIPFFTPTDASGDVFQLQTEDSITQAGLDSCSSDLFVKGTVFITARGSVGKISIAGRPMAMNQSCYALEPKVAANYPYVFLHGKTLIHHLKVKSSGSTFNSIVTNDIEWTQLISPNSEVISAFCKVVEPLFERIEIAQRESHELTQLRDWLLPLLMNGQVRVA